MSNLHRARHILARMNPTLRHGWPRHLWDDSILPVYTLAGTLGIADPMDDDCWRRIRLHLASRHGMTENDIDDMPADEVERLLSPPPPRLTVDVDSGTATLDGQRHAIQSQPALEHLKRMLEASGGRVKADFGVRWRDILAALPESIRQHIDTGTGGPGGGARLTLFDD